MDQWWYGYIIQFKNANKGKLPQSERAQNDKDIAAANAIIGLRDLKIPGVPDEDVKKYLKVNIYYVVADIKNKKLVQNEVGLFYEHATAKAKPGSFSLFLGHAPGKGVSLDSVKKTFQKPPWNNQNIPAADQPKFGILACYGGLYNAVPAKNNQLPGHMTKKDEIDALELVPLVAPQFDALSAAIKQRVINKQDAVLNIYFGAIAGPGASTPDEGAFGAAVNEAVLKASKDKTGKPVYMFKDWKSD